MTNWEKEYNRKFGEKIKRYPKKDWPFGAKDYYKKSMTLATSKKVISFISTEIAKQRTQIFKEVREKVIGEKPTVVNGVNINHNFWIKVGRSRQINQQLKKLTKLEEGNEKSI